MTDAAYDVVAARKLASARHVLEGPPARDASEAATPAAGEPDTGHAMGSIEQAPTVRLTTLRVLAGLFAVSSVVLPGFGAIDLSVTWSSDWPQVLEAGWGLYATVLVGAAFALVAVRPRRSRPAVAQLVVATVALAVSAAAAAEPRLLWLVAGLAAQTAIVGALSVRAWDARPASRVQASSVLLVLAGLGLVPWLAYALDMWALNREDRSDSDVTLGIDHYSVQGAVGLALVLLPLLAALRRDVARSSPCAPGSSPCTSESCPTPGPMPPVASRGHGRAPRSPGGSPSSRRRSQRVSAPRWRAELRTTRLPCSRRLTHVPAVKRRYDRHMARKDAKLGLVQSVPLFSHCAKRELEAIASTADLIEVPAGMELVRQGGHSNELVIIAEGAVDVTQDGTSIRSLGSGDFFGEVALVTGGTRTASVTTTTPSTLLVLTDRAFWPLAEQMPSIQTSVLKTLADRLSPETV